MEKPQNFNTKNIINDNIEHIPVDLDSPTKKMTKSEKFSFFKFLMYSTKFEIHLEELKQYLFWVSLLEIAVFFISIIVFYSYSSHNATVFAFIFELARGVFGMVIVNFIPNSSDVIETIHDNESNSNTIDEVQAQLLIKYKALLNQNEGKLKPLLIIYVVFTVICLIVPNVVFFTVLNTWSKKGFEFANLYALIICAVYFSKI